MMQDFQVYFLKDSENYGEQHLLDETMIGQPMGDMRTEQDIFRERVEKDLVALGSFSASDIINHSVY